MRIAAYCRVSTDSDRQLDSLENQKEFFTEYARKNGHELVELYADRGISGTSLRRRTEFQRLMQDAEKGSFEMVVVKDISRFARNTVDFLQSIRRLKALKIDTLFLTANMKSLGESEFVLTVFGAMAQEESANLSKRVRFGKKVNAKKGRVPQRIFGYDRVDNFTLAVNLEEAETVREIYRMYLDEGLGSWSVAGRLNAQGRLTKYGQAWDSRGVRRILENPLYCGVLVNHKYEVEDYLTGRSVRLPESENFVHVRPEWAIVTREQFERVQKELARRRKGGADGRTEANLRYSGKHLFSTLIKCECCGRSFTRKRYTYANTREFWKCSTNESYPSERCENRITVDECELVQALREWAEQLVGDWEGFVKSILAEAVKQRPKQQRTDPLASEAQRRRLELKKQRYQEMYANDIISLGELKARVEGIRRELEMLERRNTEESFAENAETGCRKQIEDFLSIKSMRNADLRKFVDHIGVDEEGNVRVYIRAV